MKSELPLSKSRQNAFDVARQAAMDAGTIIMSRFSMRKDISYKSEGKNNIVTDVDILAEKTIREQLRKEYPDFGIISEESKEIKGRAPYKWIVDPLDGTRNYAYGIPHFCVCIALVHGEDVVMGLTYDPVRDELFHAEKGCGAYLNGEPIYVTKRSSLTEALISCDMGYNPDNSRKYIEIYSNLWSNVTTTRLMGSAALGIAYTACARLDLYFHVSLYPWDIASGILLVREAGGVARQLNGEPASFNKKDIIVSNRKIADDFLHTVTKRR
ncbi:MAG: inositol monophosphatase family protein [Dehalococcoidia bacterium]|jgi:myo-inositol-1(or 4)-monophosphatase